MGADIAIPHAYIDSQPYYRADGYCAVCLARPTDPTFAEWHNAHTLDLIRLRAAIHAEDISQGELIELQNLAAYIDPFDVELLQWAGVPEFPDDDATE